MPATEVAKAALTILVPYLLMAGEAAAEKLAEAAARKASEVYEAIKVRLKLEAEAPDGDSYAEKTLDRFEDDPESNQGAMQDVLVEIMKKDQEFAQSLLELLKEAEEAGVGAAFNVAIFGGEVGQIINVDRLEGGLTIESKPED